MLCIASIVTKKGLLLDEKKITIYNVIMVIQAKKAKSKLLFKTQPKLGWGGFRIRPKSWGARLTAASSSFGLKTKVDMFRLSYRWVCVSFISYKQNVAK